MAESTSTPASPPAALAPQVHVDPTFHYIRRQPAAHEQTPEYLEYRRRWTENPLRRVVEDFPVHVDLEVTSACNLKCVHCYASATAAPAANEMTTAEGKSFIRDIAAFGAPVILFSGGEPLLRPDFTELAETAAGLGMRVALSTNGTLIDGAMAARLKQIGFAEVGISLDGIGEANDRFRGSKGAFEAALSGIRHSIENGLRVSLRLTMTRYNFREIPAIFRLIEAEGINRVCIYHLAYSGRGDKLKSADLELGETRYLRKFIPSNKEADRGAYRRQPC